MSALQRDQVRSPQLPQEIVPVASLGGDVIVRGLLMSEQMALGARVLSAKPQPGESEEAAGIRARSARVAETLARCVVLADGQPLYTAAEWDVFGAAHGAEALRLFNTAQRLNGEDEAAAEKN